MTTHNIVNGFQWLDGSFSENVEISEGRPPNDLDVVTFYGGLVSSDFAQISITFPSFINPHLSKRDFNLDHYNVDISFSPLVTVEQTRYWLQLFSHNRLGIWKGIIMVSLNTPTDDGYALDYLNSLLI